MRAKWGERMKGYERIRDGIREEEGGIVRLDPAQLVKHAFALRTEVSRASSASIRRPILLYVYAEPERWPETKKPVGQAGIDIRRQVRAFAEEVARDEVKFVNLSYRELLYGWMEEGSPDVKRHAEAVLRRFAP